MKKILFIFFLLFVYNNFFAQQIKEKQFKEIGKFEKVKLSIITVKSSNQVKVEKFLQFEQNLLENEDKRGFLDLNQINNLIKSINYIKDNIPEDIPQIYTEICYENELGFEAGIYTYGGRKSYKFWEAYLTIDRTESKYRISFFLEDFNELLSLLEKAKEMMK